TIELPPGSPYERTRAVAEQARRAVAGHPHVRRVYAAIGGGSGGEDSPGGVPEARMAWLTLGLAPRGERSGVTQQQVERELRARPGIGQVTTRSSLQRPEVIVRPDPARAADLGVSTEAIAETVRVATQGDYEQLLPRLDLDQRQVPIVVRLPEEATRDLDLLRQLTVPGARGPVPLREVATLEIASGPAQIDRLDRLRNVNFEIELDGQALGEVQRRVAQLP